jgi:hypothetical protein
MNPVNTEAYSSPASTSLTQSSRAKLHVLIISLFWLIIYIPGIFAPALLDDADSIHAEAAREMIVRHDALHQWTALSRKSASDVLGNGGELQNIRSE